MNKTPTISVGILQKAEIHFLLHGKFVLNSKTICNNDQGRAIVKNNKLCIEIGNNNLLFDSKAIFTSDNEKESYFEIKEVVIGVDFHWQQTENQRFKGDLAFLKVNNRVQVINTLSVEDYLLSVISSEMSATCSLEFLKAHAIISRSWLLAQISKQKYLKNKNTKYNSKISTETEYICWYDRENHTLFDVCADDHCQRYQGIARINTTTVKKAVSQTVGEVLTYNNEICDARFSKCCGGVSETFENCWENTEHEYLTKVVDNENNKNDYQTELTDEHLATKFIEGSPSAFCNTKDPKIISQVLNNYDAETQQFFRWQVVYTQQQISTLIKEKSGIDFGNIIDLVPIKRGESGRLIKLKIVGDKKTLIVGKELEIRRWLSKTHLYSSAFTIAKQNVQNNIPNTFVIKGAGWGHGVGLCQIGAATMGEKGYNYQEILKHYFKNISIEKIY